MQFNTAKVTLLTLMECILILCFSVKKKKKNTIYVASPSFDVEISPVAQTSKLCKLNNYTISLPSIVCTLALKNICTHDNACT